MLRLICILLFLSTAGCMDAFKPNPATQSSGSDIDDPSDTAPSNAAAPATAPTPVIQGGKKIIPADPPPLFRPQANLTIYHLTLTQGSVSRSEKFWKRVDENAIEFSAHEILDRNGIRVGLAKMADMEEMFKAVDRDPIQAQPTTFVALGSKMVEISMKKAVPEQVISYFPPGGPHAMRSYEDCDNIFTLEFQAAPRKPGDVRIGIVPLVRTLRKRMVAVGDVDTREFEYRNPEKLYPLNLRTDIPLDHMLIIAPSLEAKSSMSLGHAFLTRDGVAEKLEDLIIIIPQAIKPRTEANGQASK